MAACSLGRRPGKNACDASKEGEARQKVRGVDGWSVMLETTIGEIIIRATIGAEGTIDEVTIAIEEMIIEEAGMIGLFVGGNRGDGDGISRDVNAIWNGCFRID